MRYINLRLTYLLTYLLTYQVCVKLRDYFCVNPAYRQTDRKNEWQSNRSVSHTFLVGRSNKQNGLALV